MKKLIALLLAAVMVLGMTACGAAAKSNPKPLKRVKSRLRESMSWMLYFVRKI